MPWHTAASISPRDFIGEFGTRFAVGGGRRGDWEEADLRLVGSANWDPRSLRLNFEFNLECYSRELAASLADFARSKLQYSRPVTLTDLETRSLPVRLRDGVARLL